MNPVAAIVVAIVLLTLAGTQLPALARALSERRYGTTDQAADSHGEHKDDDRHDAQDDDEDPPSMRRSS